MSILASELIAYASASRPQNDTDASGGVIDDKVRPTYTQFTATAKAALQSSSAGDTRQVTIIGRLATGVLTNENVNLNGTNEVLSTNDFERILSVLAASATGGVTVNVKQGAGGTVRGTIPSAERGFQALFIDSASDPDDPVDRYEKINIKNTNSQSLTLTSSVLTLTADPQDRIEIGVGSVSGANSVANRLAAPGGVSFVDDGVDINVPSGQNIPAGEWVEVWVKQALLAADSAFKNTFTVRLTGNTI